MKEFNIDITQIVVALIGLLGVFVTGWFIPFIKSKITAAQWAQVVKWAGAFVKAAELIYNGPGRGEEKRNYVLNCIREECKEHNITYSENEIRAALESEFLMCKSSFVYYKNAEGEIKPEVTE